MGLPPELFGERMLSSGDGGVEVDLRVSFEISENPFERYIVKFGARSRDRPITFQQPSGGERWQ
jgi:hypothetical protein